MARMAVDLERSRGLDCFRDAQPMGFEPFATDGFLDSITVERRVNRRNWGKGSGLASEWLNSSRAFAQFITSQTHPLWVMDF